MKKDDKFTYKMANGNYISGECISTTSDTMTIILLGDTTAHIVATNYFDDIKKIEAEIL